MKTNITKRCNKCEGRKSLSEFHKNKQAKDGLRNDCKKCHRRVALKYRHVHKAKYRESSRKHSEEKRKTLMGSLCSRFYNIKHRCNNPKHKAYKNYGGRGIKCLFTSFAEFADYIINVLKIDPRGLQIDRIDNNGHYECGNIRFVTAKENSNNRRKRRKNT